jgi:hypothetical protein
MNFEKFMTEKRKVDRWCVLKIALVGMFAGCLLTTMVLLLGLLG